MLTVIVILLATVYLLVFVYFKRAWRYWQQRNVECMPVKFPFGNMTPWVQQKLSYAEILTELYSTFKPKGLRYGGFYIFTKPLLVLFDLDLIKAVLIKDFDYFMNRGTYVNLEKDPLTGNLFSLGDDKWKNLRTKLTPTFTSGKIKIMFSTVNSCALDLVTLVDEIVEKCQPMRIEDVMSRYTTDVIGSCAFGIDCNSLHQPDSEFIKYKKKVTEPAPLQALKFLLFMLLPEVLEFFNTNFFDNDTIEFYRRIVKETVEHRKINGVRRNDFLQLLIDLQSNAEDSKENGLTMDEITAQVFIFFTASYETTSTALSFCLYELSLQQQLQEKVRQEITEVLNKHNGQCTYDALAELTYLEQCIYESLRKYHPLTYLSRVCKETYRVPGTDLVLEKGTNVIIPAFAIQRDPEIFPDPLHYNPERFSAETKAQLHTCAWLPFGEGPRFCIGLRFGMMKTKLALMHLLRNFKFSVNEKTIVPVQVNKLSIILSSDKGIWLNAEKILN